MLRQVFADLTVRSVLIGFLLAATWWLSRIVVQAVRIVRAERRQREDMVGGLRRAGLL